MLRVGLTGGLGSGKSTVAAMLALRGAHVLSSDEIGRELMSPGQPVYDAIVTRFGAGVLREDGLLDRGALAKLAFGAGRVNELNAIVHPAVLADQARRTATIAAADPNGVVVFESALIFETGCAGDAGWRERFDRVLLVTAPEPLRIERFVERGLRNQGTPSEKPPEVLQRLRADAQLRIAAQIPDAQKAAWSDVVIRNEGTIEELETEVERVWFGLAAEAERRETSGSR